MSMIGGGLRKSLEEAVETRWGFGGVEKKQLSERGWGVLFSTTQNILRDFLPFAQKLFLVHIQGFKSSSPASLPHLHSISLSC
jgi:hypothetical protein